MTSLIIHSRDDDPVVVAAREAAGIGTESLRILHVDELVEFISPADWPEVLRLSLPAHIASQFNVDFIINRVFTMEGTKISTRLSELALDERWFYVRMMHYLNCGNRLAYDTGQRGVSRSLLPLYAQWYRVSHRCNTIMTPKFTYAFGAEHPNLNMLEDTIQKSVWSLFDWRVEHNISASELRQHKFFVERPKGTPVILYYIGDSCRERIYPNGYIDMQDCICNEIIQICRDEFHSEAGEILLYVGLDEHVYFYAFSPFLHSAAYEHGFRAQIATWLSERGHVPTHDAIPTSLLSSAG